MTSSRIIHQRVRSAIGALKLIDFDNFKWLDDDTLKAFYRAVQPLTVNAGIQITLRHQTRVDASFVRYATDTQWPDALETAA